MPHLQSIAWTPPDVKRRPADCFARAPLESAELVPNQGIAGDVKAKPGKRQLNVMQAEMVAELHAQGYSTAPGELGEQLVVAGFDRDSWKPGTRLRLGEQAIIELGDPREPCGRFAHIQGFPAELAVGRIGFMACVLVGGPIAAGSPVTIE